MVFPAAQVDPRRQNNLHLQTSNAPSFTVPIYDHPYRNVPVERAVSPTHYQKATKSSASYDWKQLLSKPAAITNGESSSKLQRRETASTLPTRRAASEDTSTVQGRGFRSSSEPERGLLNWNPIRNSMRSRRSTDAPSIQQSSGTLARNPSMNAVEVVTQRKEKDKRPLGLLRRKSSHSKSTSSPSESNLSAAMAPSPLPYSSSFVPSSSNSNISPTSHYQPISTLQPPSQGRTRINSTSSLMSHSSQSSTKGYERDREDASPSMTPAEEVMLAYKRQMEREQSIERIFQEAERKAMEARRLSDERAEAVKALREKELERGREQLKMMQGAAVTPLRNRATPPEPVSDNFDQESENKDSTPYYTIYGANEENYSHRHRSASVSVGPSLQQTKQSFRKSLGRKMSFRWGGSRQQSPRQQSPTTSLPVNGEEDDKRSSQQTISPSTLGDRQMFPSVRMSLDQSPPISSRLITSGGKNVRKLHIRRPSTADASIPSPSISGSSSPSDSPTGNKFRHLLRRISTNGLRERRGSRSEDLSSTDSPEQTPPPVPALPQGVVSVMKSGSTRPSGSRSAPQTPSSGAESHKYGSEYASRSRTSSSVPPSTSSRPSFSTATRSSSPDRFSRSRSSRSSISSYGKEVPPLPTSSLVKLDNNIRPRGPRNSTQSNEYRSESPPIPEFSTTAAINAFPSPRKSGSRRPVTTAGAVSPTSTTFPRPLPLPPRRPRTSESSSPSPAHTSSRPLQTIRRKASKAFSDDGSSIIDHALPLIRKPSTIISRAKSYNPPAASARDEARWESLLEKSDRAGGTLHIGIDSCRLESDNLQFST